MLCGEEGRPGLEVALPQMRGGGVQEKCHLLEQGWGLQGGGLCPAVLCQQGEDGFESSAG